MHHGQGDDTTGPAGPAGGRGEPRPGSDGAAPTWEHVVARFRGAVGEVDDPLTWGLDLDEETLTGVATRDTEPTQERFLRSYLSFAGETLDVETLRLRADDAHALEAARTALASALATLLQGETAGGLPVASEDDKFVDSYAEYRASMRAIVEEVDAVPPEHVAFDVDGTPHPCLRLTLRASAAVYVPWRDRSLVVAGPRELVDGVDVVMRPLRSILQGDG